MVMSLYESFSKFGEKKKLRGTFMIMLYKLDIHQMKFFSKAAFWPSSLFHYLLLFYISRIKVVFAKEI